MPFDAYSLALPYEYIDAFKLLLEAMIAFDIALLYRLPVKGRVLMRYSTTAAQELARSGPTYLSFVFAVLILMVIEWNRVGAQSLVLDAALIVVFSWFFLAPRTVVLTDVGVVANGRMHKWRNFSSYRVNTITRMIKLKRRSLPFLDPLNLVMPTDGDAEAVVKMHLSEDPGMFGRARAARRSLDDRTGPGRGV